MKTNEIEKLYESARVELQILELQCYTLDHFIKVLKMADKEYDSLLLNIANVESELKDPTISTSIHTYLEQVLQQLKTENNNGFIQVQIEKEVRVYYWVSSQFDYSYDADSIRVDNSQWKEELELMRTRNKALQQFCNSQGINCNIKEETQYPFENKSIVQCLTFQVPISMLEKTDELSSEKVKTYFKNNSLHNS